MIHYVFDGPIYSLKSKFDTSWLFYYGNKKFCQPFSFLPVALNIEDYASDESWKIIQYCLFFRKEIIGETMENASIYLFPFIIEYSIIGSSVIYNMWKSIGRPILCAIKDSVTELKTPSFSC